MITFTIIHDNITKEIQMDDSETFFILKEKIIQQFQCTCNYVDIYIVIDKPIRCLGKFNIDKGLFPRTLDRYPFERYDLEGRNISINFTEINDYKNKTIIHKEIKQGSYRTPQSRVKSPEAAGGFQGDITSMIDFPPIN